MPNKIGDLEPQFNFMSKTVINSGDQLQDAFQLYMQEQARKTLNEMPKMFETM